MATSTRSADERPRIGAVARQRRHTLSFLTEIRSFSPVFLDTEVDMTAVQAHRSAARAEGRRISLVAYVLHAGGRVLAAHPEANAAVSGRNRLRVARYGTVNGKLALDKRASGHRVVMAAVLPDLHRSGLPEIQRQIDTYRDADPDSAPEFAGARLLHRLPPAIGRALFRLSVRSLRRRGDLLGTFAVTSLGHRPVDGFYSVGGTTITLGVGRVVDRPVAVDGQVRIAPVMRLSLAFDHRVIDGAEAADVLADVKERLEGFEDAPLATPRTRRDVLAVAGDGSAVSDDRVWDGPQPVPAVPTS